MGTVCNYSFGPLGYSYRCQPAATMPWQFWYNIGPHYGQFGWY